MCSLEFTSFLWKNSSFELSVQWRIQDFPDGGEGATPKFGAKSIIWQHFSQKLNENE